MGLPINELKKEDITPKRFFIWGDNMSGKTYLAREFPNPFFINTDGNSVKIPEPGEVIYDFESFVKILQDLEKGDHSYETIVIDLVDDILTMLQIFVAEKYGVETEGEVPYGNGYKDVKQKWQQLMVRICRLPYNVVFISYINEKDDNGSLIEIPSLDSKFCKVAMGRTDISIKTKQVGSNYLRYCIKKRAKYKEEDIKDERTLKILKTITGVFENSTNQLKKLNNEGRDK